MSARSGIAAIWCFPACAGAEAGLPEQPKVDGGAVDADERGLHLGVSGEGGIH